LNWVLPTHLVQGELPPNWGKGLEVVETGLVTGIPIGNMVETNIMYVGVRVSIAGYETKVNSIPLELHDFGINLDMISRVSTRPNRLPYYNCYVPQYQRSGSLQ
jgi:hypothetical protein